MSDIEEMKNNANNEQELEDDVEIAELARQELDKRDKEIKKLKKELAQSKLLREPQEEQMQVRTKEECLDVILNSSACNYDYAVAVCDLVDIERGAGRPNPLGKDGDKVYDFFDECIASCNGDKTKFPSVYQSKIGNDDAVMFARNKKR